MRARDGTHVSFIKRRSWPDACPHSISTTPPFHSPFELLFVTTAGPVVPLVPFSFFFSSASSFFFPTLGGKTLLHHEGFACCCLHHGDGRAGPPCHRPSGSIRTTCHQGMCVLVKLAPADSFLVFVNGFFNSCPYCFFAQSTVRPDDILEREITSLLIRHQLHRQQLQERTVSGQEITRSNP